MNTKATILDIAMNLNRVGNWAADDYLGKKARIKTFLGNTTAYIKSLSDSPLPPSFAGTFSDFTKHYSLLEKEGLAGPQNPLFWAEDMMTWGNILTHRSQTL
ncbi:MAG: hypothetical protein UW73_C0019G0008 [Microgenomates group bacterium GW2011_GWB1_44_8]|nr:MAG: hypothetical protein UW73_C0019G0008 [Microgenomates group bacterium GW2011_GWB1_44_8]